VLVGFLILSGAVNTSIVGSNGVLNRLAEDGVLTPWFLHPQKRFGTTHRLINTIALLQILTIIASMGDVYTLGEAYAFGVIWSFVFKTLAMVVLRFKNKSQRAYEVPLNIRIHRKSGQIDTTIDLPIGITIIFLILLSTAIVNLFTKKVATVWGIGFTLGFLTMFLVCEAISKRLRRDKHFEHREQFNEKVVNRPTRDSLGLHHSNPVLVAIRNPKSMPVLNRVLDEIDTTMQDIVAVTCKVLPAMTPGITDEEMSVNENDREVLTKVVNLAEEAGKTVYPLVIPTNNPLYAIALAARDLGASQVVLGASEKSDPDLQLEQFAIAWGMAGADGVESASRAPSPPLSIRIIGSDRDVRLDL
jgi:nucleotide-binding universal stress UspA family protein